MSIYMTISLSVERYISVVHPLWARKHRSIRFCILLAAPGLAFSLLFTLPNYFLLRTEPVNISTNLGDLHVLDKVRSNYFPHLFHNINIVPVYADVFEQVCAVGYLQMEKRSTATKAKTSLGHMEGRPGLCNGAN